MGTKIFILLVALFASAWSAPRENATNVDTYSKVANSKIVGGGAVSPHSVPYMAAILFKDTWYGGGALITERWVLTTVNCALHSAILPTVILGAHKISAAEESQQRISADDIIAHEGTGTPRSNNIALVHLEKAAELNEYVSIIPVAPFNAPNYEGTVLRLIGFGLTSAPNSQGTLRSVDVGGITNSDCKSFHGDLVQDGTICTDTSGGKGGCWRDLGGPLVDIDRGLLVGLMVSYDKDPCGSGVPNLLTRVSSFNKFIVNSIY